MPDEEMVLIPKRLLTVCTTAAQKLMVLRIQSREIKTYEIEQLEKARDELRRLDGWNF